MHRGVEPADLLEELASREPHSVCCRLCVPCRFHTDESIRGACQAVRDAYAISKAAGYEEEVCQGWNRTEFSMVVGPPYVGVVSSLMWDWSHTFISNGLADTELGMLFKVFQKTPGSGSYVEFREYLKTWRLPLSRECPLNLFSDEQIRLNLKDTKFSCGASDMLNLSPILLKYLRDVVHPRGLCLDHVECMIAVLEALELLQATKGGLVDAQQLEDRPQIK